MKSLCWWLAVFVPSVVLGVGWAQAGPSQVESKPIGASVSDQVAPSDLAGIRAAYRVGQRRFVSTRSGFAARDPRQAWALSFDGRGFAVTPDGGAWTWGMELESFGFAGFETKVPGQAESEADGARLSYGWDGNLSEWFVNGERGLKHGFTLQQRPMGAGPLRFQMEVRGDLSGRGLPGGNGLGFADASGDVVVTYTGLRVFDALGVDQPANLTMGDGQVSITIHEATATYPLTIDPIAQDVYLKASNTGWEDHFGGAVAVSGNTVVVGAAGEDSAATGINGHQADDSAWESGAAYVFVKVGGVWSQQAYLKASNAEQYDQFAISLALDGDTLVVGARGEKSDATGVNGDESNNNALSSGAAYVFARTGTAWAQEAYLKASNTGDGDGFGHSVSISGDTIVVGAYSEDSKSGGINGDETDNGVSAAGAAYAFVRGPTGWVQQAYIKASNPLPGAGFGADLSISQDVLVVGAYGESSDGIGVNGSQTGLGEPDCGAAYVFERVGGVWSQSTYLKPDVNRYGILFGHSVGATVDTVAVSVPLEAKIYVYGRTPTGWVHESLLEPEVAGTGQVFGGSLTIHGERILVGAPGENGGSRGINGNPAVTQAGHSSGAAYLYRKAGPTWVQEAYMKASNPGSIDHFGTAVDMTDNLAVIGASLESGGYTGPYARENDDSIYRSGAAYVFELNAEYANYCGPDAFNSMGMAGHLIHSGSLSTAANDFTLHVSGLPVGQVGFFLSAMSHDFVANPGGSQGHLCLGRGHIGRHNRPHELQMSSGQGTFDLNLDLQDMPHPTGTTTVLAGQTWNFQAWYRDVNPTPTSNFTGGLSVRFH